MIRYLYLLTTLLMLASAAYAQADSTCTIKKDTIVIDTTNHQRMLLGYCNRESFRDTSFSWWFNSVYDMYEMDSVTALSFKDKLNDIKVTVVMGTWCSDSRRVVPKVLRLLDNLKFPGDNITMIAVGRDRKGRQNETEGLKIELVPTIIFYKNNKEIGRIVESPKETIEKDLSKILNG